MDVKRCEYPYQFQYELLNKEKINKASDAVIDLLTKEHKLSELECAYTLECLLKSLGDTMGCTFDSVFPASNKSNAIGGKE